MRVFGGITFEQVTKRMTTMTYRDLRKRRNNITNDLANRWVYRHTTYGSLRPRDPGDDRLVVAWLNAEMNRRIWADPLVAGGAIKSWGSQKRK